MATDSWSSILWESVPSSTIPSLVVWHKSNVPYKAESTALQTLDVWVPGTPGKAPPQSSMPEREGLWFVYIHGGAWRDPLVDSTSLESTVEYLLKVHPDTLRGIAGIASLNYNLSPHPNHATHPAPPKEAGQPPYASRQAKHPDHITDVLTGLSFIQQKAGFGGRYILAGHSCGATLAFQVAMDNLKWSTDATASKLEKPKAILGLNGIYDLPDLIANPGPKHAQLGSLYEAFTRNAFGDDRSIWEEVSPSSVKDWSGEWPEGVKAVLVQSKDDSLVPYKQTEDMLEKLRTSSSKNLDVEELEAGGDHNDLWKYGASLAEIISILIKSL